MDKPEFRENKMVLLIVDTQNLIMTTYGMENMHNVFHLKKTFELMNG